MGLSTLILSAALFVAVWVGIPDIRSQATLTASDVVVSGSVHEQRGNTLYINTSEGMREVLLSSQSQIYKDGAGTEPGQIQSGDKVEVIQNGNVPVINVTSTNIAGRFQSGINNINWGNWFLLGSFMAMLGGILMFMVRRNRTSILRENEREEKYQVGGLEAKSLSVFDSIEHFLQSISMGIQKTLQGGRSAVNT